MAVVLGIAGLPAAASANPSPNSSSRMPRCSKLVERRRAPTPRRGAGSRNRRARRRTRRPTTSGMYSRQTSLRTPPKSTSAISVSSRSSMLDHPARARPDTWRSPLPSDLRAADEHLAERQAAVVRWHVPVAQHGEAVVPQTLSASPTAAARSANTPPDSATVSRPVVGSAARRQRRATSAATAGVEPGADHARPATPSRTSRATARTTGAASSDHRRRRRRGRTGMPLNRVLAPGQPLQLDRRLGLVVDDVADARRATRPRRRAGPCSRSARSRARSRSWWRSTRRSALGAGPHRRQVGVQSTPAARRCASAIR